MPAPWKESYEKPTQCIKKQKHLFADKGPYSQRYGFFGSFFGSFMCRCESWTTKKASAISGDSEGQGSLAYCSP